MPIGEDIRTAGELLLASDLTIPPESLAEKLNEALNRFLPPRFRAVRAHAITKDGIPGPEFLSMVVDTNRLDESLGIEIPAEAMACVFDVHNTLDLEALRLSYGRIAEAKLLSKADPAPEGDFRPTNVTYGVILARESTIPVEMLARELDQLNRALPSRQWTNMIVVLPKGVVQYGMQFPGDIEMSGFLPPSHNTDGGIPAYVHILVYSAAEYALNRLLTQVWLHAGTFSTGLNIGQHIKDLLLDAPSSGVTICAYQFTLAGELRPVPDEEYITSKFFPPPIVTIQSRGGKVLGGIQFVPWQDGAYLASVGMPLAPLLVVFGKSEYTRTITRANGELSYVLPINANSFNMALSRFQQRSNMVVKPPDPPSWTMSKVADEGTSSPFIARLYLGISGLRDRVKLPTADHEGFDKEYEAVLTALENARDAEKNIIKELKNHRERLLSGVIVQRKNQTLTITEEIDRALRKEIESFLNAAVRATKDNQQRVLRRLGIEAGFLFKKQGAFDTGISSLRAAHPEFSDFLMATRQGWLEQLIRTRNALHTSWTIDRVKYNPTEQTVNMVEPKIDGIPISSFVTTMLDRLLCFVEETTTYGLKTHLPEIISIREVPISERKPDTPERFRLVLATDGSLLWHLIYHEMPFENV